MTTREVYPNRRLLRMRNTLAAAMATTLVLVLSTAAHAATIMVNSLADTGRPGICTLRDAITAANNKTATNGCTAGTGSDTILFCVSGTIALASTLPTIIDHNLTIKGPASPGITIDGSNSGNPVQVMQVASGARLNLNKLTIANGSSSIGNGSGIDNNGTLTVTNSTFSGNSAGNGGVAGGGIANEYGGMLTVTNSTFTGNFGGGIENDGGTLTVTKNTILAANPGGNCFGLTDAGYNISDDSSCGFSATGSHNSTDPKLDPAGLANHGGPTQTIALLAGSPAIDAIPLANCTDQASPPNPLITDQRLFPRPDAGEAHCDIGAYEVQDKPFLPFSHLSGGMAIDADAGVFYVDGGFTLAPGGSIDPVTEPVTFNVGSYALTLPVGSFVGYNNGYVYQKTVNGIFVCIFIKFTSTPGRYVLLVEGRGVTPATTSPVPVTLIIGNDGGTTHMNARFD